MNASKILIACAAVLAGSVAAQAQTVVHISGSSAFRSSTITAIQTLMGGPGQFKAAFQQSSGSSTLASAQCVIQGNITGLPVGANPVTVKCVWTGSVGGIRDLVLNRDLATWMSVVNLPADNTSVPIIAANMNYQLDPTVFAGENGKVDVILADNSQASSGFTSTQLIQKKVGIIPFEWVANNGSPAEMDNMTPLLAQAVLSGGAPLSQLTGNAAQAGVTVYAVGRNFDSGTRLSCLSETGIGVFGGVQQVEITTVGDLAPGSQVDTTPATINQLKLYRAETILDQVFTVGQSGYSSGGTMADVLATPGSSTAVTGNPVPAAQRVGFGPGWLVGYVGRSDASRAVKRAPVTGNSAHRMKWNGYQIWNGEINPTTGAPLGGYNDHLITEGLYNLWEYEYLSYKQGLDPSRQAVADRVATQIENVDATLSGIKVSSMHVSKSIEGGLITHL